MSEPFLGEVKLFAGNFAPRGWLFCQGQLLSIAQNSALYSLLGTTYGGDGQTTFAVPDLRGRAVVHQGQGPGLSNYTRGQQGGAEAVTLLPSHLPAHSHAPVFTGTAGDASTPVSGGAIASQGPAGSTQTNAYIAYSSSNQVALAAQSVSAAGGNQPHDNMQPLLGLNYIIAVEGLFPTQA